MTYKMTPEYQKLLTEMIGECWHEFEPLDNGIIPQCKKCSMSMLFPWTKNRTFTEPKDKQDLLEKVIEKGEWLEWLDYLWYEDTKNTFVEWLIQLSPEETAELICKWKGVE